MVETKLKLPKNAIPVAPSNEVPAAFVITA
jgi:hypothetical protein